MEKWMLKLNRVWLLYIVSFCILCSSVYSQSTDHYIREGTTGDGSDWSLASDELPQTLERDHTYYIADGNYASYNFDDSGAGTITIKKATTADHGTESGWDNTYGDDQAVFGPIIFNADNIIFDGSYEYGFHVLGNFQGLVADVNSNHIVIRNTDLDGDFQMTGNQHTSGSCNVMNIDGTDVQIENCDIRNAADDGVGIYGNDISLIHNKVHQLHGCGTDGGCGPCYNGHSDGLELQDTTNVLLVGNMIYDIESTAALITGQWSPGMYTRNLEMYNNILYTPKTGITAYISHVQGAKIYNNVIWGRTDGDRYGGLAIGPEATDIELYNNIVLNINFNHLGASYDASNHFFDNNLFFALMSSEYTPNANDIIADPMFAGIVESSDISDHIGAGLVKEDFMLQAGSPAIDAGIVNADVLVDILGNPRDANPDIGCFEVQGSTSGCGDGTCDTSESCTTCPADCGACGPECGDGICDTSESCSTCDLDCGRCECVHEADNDPCDGIVDTTELDAYVNSWKSGIVEMVDLMTAINIWKNS